MEVSVESLGGLKRKMFVSIPAERLETQAEAELKKLVARVQIDGYRRGKAPLNLVKMKYASSVRVDVAKNLLNETLEDALKQKSLSPVSSPEVEIFELEDGKDFRYGISFEVYPEIVAKDLSKKNTVEIVKGTVKASDVDAIIEKLREKNKVWNPVERASKMGDKVRIDFKGAIHDKPIERGAGEDFSLELGSHQMIPGFEEALVGHKAGETFSIQVSFPKEYQESTLAGQPAQFEIKLHEVSAGELPPVDAELAKALGVASGDVAELRADLHKQMERELTLKTYHWNHKQCFDVFVTANPIELPEGLINKEIEQLKHEFYHQIYGAKHTANEVIPDFPRELFEEEAKYRVHLGLLLTEYLATHKIVAEEKVVEACLERAASAYSDPELFKQKVKGDAQWLAEFERAAVEQIVVERLLSHATLSEKEMTYDQIMQLKKEFKPQADI